MLLGLNYFTVASTDTRDCFESFDRWVGFCGTTNEFALCASALNFKHSFSVTQRLNNHPKNL